MAERTFTGRALVPGNVTAEALVSHGGFNTLASYQKTLLAKNLKAVCSDQNNPDLYKKPMAGRALCLPQTIGSTTGGMVLMCACDMGAGPACMLFSRPIDSLAAAGAFLARNWTSHPMAVVDGLGDEFLESVRDGNQVEVREDGTVVVRG
jgi:predicted aconitase with swiveling domain